MKMTFIGAGRITQALIAGLLRAGYLPENITVTSKSTETAALCQSKWQVKASNSNIDAIADADLIIFCVKPQILPTVLQEIGPHIRQHQLCLSVVTGARVSDMLSYCSAHPALVRAMPNIAGTVGSGATGLYCESSVDEEKRSIAESIMRVMGVVVWVNSEMEMDIVTALSGSGSAYFFKVMESLQNAAIQSGLSRESARLLVAQTALGAGHLALESKASLSDLIANVTSPQGTTAAAMSVLTEANVEDIFARALNAAKDRAEVLADGFGH